MPSSFERTIAELLKPKLASDGNENIERLQAMADTINLTDTLVTTLAAPERRVGFARVGYSETA